MQVSEARTFFRKITERYFTHATVEFAKQSFSVKKEKPLVLLTFGSIDRPMNPPTAIVDGRPVSFYPTTMTVQVDLFTKGRERTIAKGITSAMENTAEEDLLSFLNFLNSEFVIQLCHQYDFAIIIPNMVNDLTDLINDTNYEFRAMVEVELRFTTIAIGYTGTVTPESVKKPGDGSSGGGTGGDSEDAENGENGSTNGGDETFDWLHDEFDENTTIKPSYEENPSGGGALESESADDGFFSNVSINNKLIKEDDEQ